MKSMMLLLLPSFIVSSIPPILDPNLNQDGDATEPFFDQNSNSLFKYETNICVLSDDVLDHIGHFLVDAVYTLGLLNQRFYNTFHDKFSLKNYVMKRFNIPEFEDLNKNEKELHCIFSLTRCRNDVFLLFGSLIEDVASGKKPYKALLPSLIAFLERIFKNFSHIQQQNFENYASKQFNCSFKNILAQICARNSYYELTFALLKENSRELVDCLSKIEKREELMEFFKVNSGFATIYKGFLPIYRIREDMTLWEISENMNIFKWIAECIIYDAPEEFYTDLLGNAPYILTHLDKDLFLFPQISESEYPRIHVQVQRMLNNYLSPLITATNFAFYNLINDIRFGSIDSQNFDFFDFDDKMLVTVAKAALIGRNPAVFLQIYESLAQERIQNVFNQIIKMEISSDYVKNFKIFFELIAYNPRNIKIDHNCLTFLAKFYAINHIIIENDRINIEFMALENLLIYEFPPIIRIDTEFANDSVKLFADNIFWYMKVFNEDTITSVLVDYAMFSKKEHTVSFELMKFISESSILAERFINSGIKLLLDQISKNLAKYLNLPVYTSLNGIVETAEQLCPLDLTKLKTEKQLKALERAGCKNVSHYYFKWEPKKIENHQEIVECDYFQWRIVFSYWIKNRDKERIREIRSGNIVKMLRLEFPGEMNRLLELEAL